MSPWTTLHSIWKHPANCSRKFQAISRYFWWQAAKRTVLKHFDLPFHGLKLRCYPDSHSASAVLYFSGLPDFREMQFMRHYLRHGDCFVDVGANIGVYTLLAASIVGSAGVVHAFEPVQRTFDRLTENVVNNRLDQVHCHRLALSETPGTARLTNPGDDSLIGIASCSMDRGTDEVPCATVDSVLAGVSIAMMKIDVEGAEPLVLRGARSHLQAGNPPVMQIEMDGYSARYGLATHEFIDEIESYGYEIAIYDPQSHRLIATRRPWEHDVLNVLVIHRGAWTAVESRLGVARA